MLTAADREIRLGLWKIHVLHHAAQRDVWGLWLLDELAEHGHRLSPGTLYPAIRRMEQNGWLRTTNARARAAPNARRTYRITPAGRKLLAALKHDIEELHREVVLGEDEAAPTRVSRRER